MAVYHEARQISGNAGAKRIAATVASEFKCGNLVVLASNKAALASGLSDAGTKAQNQEAAHDVFLGVAIDGKLANQTADILVASRGEFLLPCAALGQAYDIGTYFGFEGTGSAGAVGVSDTNVEPVATANLAVGRLSRAGASGDTLVYVEIAGVLTTTHAGTQALA